jgi:hypothetical protein
MPSGRAPACARHINNVLRGLAQACVPVGNHVRLRTVSRPSDAARRATLHAARRHDARAGEEDRRSGMRDVRAREGDVGARGQAQDR